MILRQATAAQAGQAAPTASWPGALAGNYRCVGRGQCVNETEFTGHRSNVVAASLRRGSSMLFLLLGTATPTTGQALYRGYNPSHFVAWLLIALPIPWSTS